MYSPSFYAPNGNPPEDIQNNHDFLAQLHIIWETHPSYDVFAEQLLREGFRLPSSNSFPPLDTCQMIRQYVHVYLSLGRMYESRGQLGEAIAIYDKFNNSCCSPGRLQVLFLTKARCY